MAKADGKEPLAFKIFNSVPSALKPVGDMCIVISPNFAFLEEELRVSFEGQDDVRVTVDRRKDERRRSSQHVSSERRKVNRRRSKAELLEVVIAT